MNKRPELVSPAGDWPALRSAVAAGCDSVYFGAKSLNMRQSAGNFDLLELGKIMSFLHDNGKKGYLTLNVLIFNNELERARKILGAAKSAGVDAIILWDMAALNIAKELGMKVHLSTQASVSNIEAVKFYASLGVKRIVMARECALTDMKEIISYIGKEKLDCEIETFIHGAMCLSVSGRCLLSEHSFGRLSCKEKEQGLVM